ncbi:unnamed protein product [Prorocentrum cordatum]|uniref:EF-hand domain-containing protein n=1 Tax=Prorocentrum cordatum TaxID=2364126 RepID=A0ABN9UY92_9DINO|nr:unnamed protein product [Polarella glacialis]
MTAAPSAAPAASPASLARRAPVARGPRGSTSPASPRQPPAGRACARRSSPAANVSQGDFLTVGLQNMLRATSESLSDTRAAVQEGQAELRRLLNFHGGGSFMRGWRLELDPDGVLQIDFQTFCRAAGRIRFSGDTQALFSVDADSRYLTMEEVYPAKGQLMGRFRQWIQQTFGSPVALFHAASHGAATVTREQFCEFLQEKEWGTDAKELADICDCIDFVDSGDVRMDDVLFLELDPRMRDEYMFRVRMDSMQEWRMQAAQDFVEMSRTQGAELGQGGAKRATHRLAPRPWQEHTFEKLPHVACQERYRKARVLRRRQTAAKRSFQKHLQATFGHEVRALRRSLGGPGSPYFVCRDILRHQLSKSILQVDARALWQALDEERENSAERGKWTGTSTARMNFSSFRRVLAALGYPAVSDKEHRGLLMTSLDLMGCGFVERGDLLWLDGWDAPEWISAEPDEEAWSQLRSLLEQSCGHLLCAWTQLLDQDSSNKISWDEFEQACSRIKFSGNVAGAWRVLDEDLSGYITMNEFDQPSADLLSSFKSWTERYFGSVSLWFEALDAHNQGWVALADMRRAFRRHSWDGDVRLLFDCLATSTVDPGNGALQISQSGNGTRNKSKKETMVRSSSVRKVIVLEDVEFLDSWTLQLPEESLLQCGREESCGGSSAGSLKRRSLLVGQPRPSTAPVPLAPEIGHRTILGD